MPVYDPARTIPLTQGYVAIVDAEDYEAVSQFKWCVETSRKTKMLYAVRSYRENGRSHRVKMHRYITGAPRCLDVDHRDRDGLNNRRENLRLATRSQNLCNRPAQSNNKSGFKGVFFHKASGKWMALIEYGRKKHYLGLFETPESAGSAYTAAASRLHGEFAYLEVEQHASV